MIFLETRLNSSKIDKMLPMIKDLRETFDPKNPQKSKKFVDKIDKYMANLWGFSDVCLNIFSADVKYMDAYTIIYLDDVRKVQPPKNFKFDPKDNIELQIFITQPLLFNPEFSDKEILAILLHEVGHNFYGGLQTYIIKNNKKTYEAQMRDLQKAQDLRAKDPKVIKTLLKKKDSNLFSAMTIISDGLESMLKSSGSVLKTLINYFNSDNDMVDSIFNLQVNWSHNTETFADQFVVTYGYGTELSSALLKLKRSIQTDSGNATDVQPGDQVVAKIRNFVKISLALCFLGIDISWKDATIYKRLNSIADSMRQELNNSNLSDEDRKAISSELDEVQAIIGKMDNDISMDKIKATDLINPLARGSALQSFSDVIYKTFLDMNEKLYDTSSYNDIQKVIDVLVDKSNHKDSKK